MNNKSMTEAELIEFLTALSDNCGNKKKMEWYHGLIDDIGIAFTENNTPDAIAEASIEELESEIFKGMQQNYYSKKSTKKPINELPNLPKSTENLSKIADKDEWLNEVKGNDVLGEKFKYAITWMGSDLDGKVQRCVEIAKQYSDSKLSELEKWIDEVIEEQHYHIAIAAFNEVKDKIQSLK